MTQFTMEVWSMKEIPIDFNINNAYRVRDELLWEPKLPTTLADIIEETARNYGGGVYKLLIFNHGKRNSSKIFELAGKAKTRPCTCNLQQLMIRGCQNKAHI